MGDSGVRCADCVEGMRKIREGISVYVKVITLVLLFFGISVYASYATDSYATLAHNNTFHGSAIDMFYRNGRPVIALIYELFYRTGLPNETFYYISSVLALVFLAAAVILLEKTYESYVPRENTRILLCFLAVANLYIIEYFMFIEKCGFMLAIFFAVAAVAFTERFMKWNRIWYLAAACLCTIACIFTYQGVLALYVMLCLPLVYRNAKDFKQYFVNIVAVGGGIYSCCDC